MIINLILEQSNVINDHMRREKGAKPILFKNRESVLHNPEK